jgi:hypothetical protein
MSENIKLPAKNERVFISMEYAGFRAMQVCVLPDVPDAEILEVCNRLNPQLTQRGWHTVIKDKEHAKQNHVDECSAPGQCVECPERLHKIVLCL